MNRKKINRMRLKSDAIIFACFLLAGCFSPSAAQAPLTPEEAVKQALQYNYAIEIATAELQIAKNNNTAGNAGMLPKVGANASNYWSNTNIHQELSSGTLIDNSDVNGNGINASLGFAWTLFDGTRMFVVREKLKKTYNSSEFQYRMVVEDLVYRVMELYYGIIRQNQQVAATESIIELYEKRLEVVRMRKESGSASEVDVLQAGVDLSTQQINLRKQQIGLENLSLEFARTVWSDPGHDFILPDSIVLSGLINSEELKKKMLSENTGIKVSELDVAISHLLLKENRSSRYPKLGFGLNYNFARTESGAGYMLGNMNYGLNYGFSLSIPIFDGFSVTRSIRNARLQETISNARYQDIRLQLDVEFMKLYNLYSNNSGIVDMEIRNLAAAKFSLDIASRKYELGILSDISYREVQKSYEESQVRLINAVFEAKMNELDLMRISGMLVK